MLRSRNWVVPAYSESLPRIAELLLHSYSAHSATAQRLRNDRVWMGAKQARV